MKILRSSLCLALIVVTLSSMLSIPVLATDQGVNAETSGRTEPSTVTATREDVPYEIAMNDESFDFVQSMAFQPFARGRTTTTPYMLPRRSSSDIWRSRVWSAPGNCCCCAHRCTISVPGIMNAEVGTHALVHESAFEIIAD